MKKHHFESLARVIAEHNARCLTTFGPNASRMSFSDEYISALADWCEGQTKDKPDGRRFDRAKWIGQCNGLDRARSDEMQTGESSTAFQIRLNNQ